jgi:hypothetical protein
MYVLIYHGDKPPKLPNFPKGKPDEILWGSAGKQARYLAKLRCLLSKIDEKSAKSWCRSRRKWFVANSVRCLW